MKKFYSVSKAAEMADMTSETLRHYDRIGLVKPAVKEGQTGYRYYSEQEIIRLSTVQALQYMGLSLIEIKRILEANTLEVVIASLIDAERQADIKIDQLRQAKQKIGLARRDYEKKAAGQVKEDGLFVRQLPERVILLSETLESPSLENLWNYHRHFYDQIKEYPTDSFVFEDQAGIYTKDGCSRLFAVCAQYPALEGLTILPAGRYLCANCTEPDKEEVAKQLFQSAESAYGAQPEFVLHIIAVSGILQWNYQAQVFLTVCN